MAANVDPLFCSKCGTPRTISSRIGRRDTCSKCDADLHSCVNCRHYNVRAHNECNEPQAEWVREKDRANFCDYYDPRRGKSAAGTQTSATDDARTRFENLFKK